MSYDEIAKTVKRLAAYEDAEEQGLLIQLPCKVGQPVYTIDDASICTFVDGEEEIDHILQFEYGEDGLQFSIEWYEPRSVSEIGKTVFFTRKEAEAALKEQSNDKS